MKDDAPSRRSFLSHLTGGGVAIGALVAGGALVRSCAPVEQRFTLVDFSDMFDGEMRGYAINHGPAILIRQGDQMTVWDGKCPNDWGWILTKDLAFDGLYCAHCTRRYNRAGQRTDRNGGLIDAGNDLPLQPLPLNLDSLVLRVDEDEPMPRQTWSSI